MHPSVELRALLDRVGLRFRRVRLWGGLAVCWAVLAAVGLVAGVRLALVASGPTSIGGPGSVWTAVTGTGAPTGMQIVVALCLTGALATLAAIAIFRSSERRARELGLLDRTTGS